MLKENEGRGGDRWEGEEGRHLEKKQPDSPAVCNLIAHPPVTWQKRREGVKRKGRKKKNNLNTHTEEREGNMT